MRPALPAAFLLVLGATACGTPATQPSPTAAVTASPTAVDPCLVGSWRTVSVTGTLTDPSGGGPISLTGGAGGVLAVNGDGSIQIDDTRAEPDTGTAADGTRYTITASGSGSGHVVSSAGQITVTLDPTAAVTQTIARNGTVLTSQKPSSATDLYQCSRGHTLAITSSGGIVSTFVPAG